MATPPRSPSHVERAPLLEVSAGQKGKQPSRVQTDAPASSLQSAAVGNEPSAFDLYACFLWVKETFGSCLTCLYKLALQLLSLLWSEPKPSRASPEEDENEREHEASLVLERPSVAVIPGAQPIVQPTTTQPITSSAPDGKLVASAATQASAYQVEALPDVYSSERIAALQANFTRAKEAFIERTHQGEKSVRLLSADFLKQLAPQELSKTAEAAAYMENIVTPFHVENCLAEVAIYLMALFKIQSPEEFFRDKPRK